MRCDLYEPAAHVLADVLGLDEPDAKSLILVRQTWKMYRENNLKGRLPSYRELKRMGGVRDSVERMEYDIILLFKVIRNCCEV